VVIINNQTTARSSCPLPYCAAWTAYLPALNRLCLRSKHLNVPPDHFLTRKSGQIFYNTSELGIARLLADSTNIKPNLLKYVASFCANAGDIFERYEFTVQVERLDNANLLYQVVQKFANVNLHPDVVDNATMGLVFEELIRRFAELSNETAGEHYTPREVIRLAVNLLFNADDEVTSQPPALVAKNWAAPKADATKCESLIHTNSKSKSTYTLASTSHPSANSSTHSYRNLFHTKHSDIMCRSF
jgi:hypothetical protein